MILLAVAAYCSCSLSLSLWPGQLRITPIMLDTLSRAARDEGLTFLII